MNLSRLLVVAAASVRLLALEASAASVQRFVTVEKDVKLEVLDWGGSGRSVVLLAGLGDGAHAFDGFADKLAIRYHVFGISRRGFGASSVPPAGYSSERLGEDVLAVLDSLAIEKPILVGHSIAGSELSYIGSSHPEKVAALVYLDAAYEYAYYDETTHAQMNLLIDSIELGQKLEQLPSAGPQNLRRINRELWEIVQRFQDELRDQYETMKDIPVPATEEQSSMGSAPQPSHLIFAGLRKYKTLRAPALAVYAVHQSAEVFGPGFPKSAAERIRARTAAQIDAFEKGNPSARVVRIPNGSHFIFRSNEPEVLREIDQFIGRLPPSVAMQANPKLR